MKTYQPKQKEINRKWHLVDAKGAVLGRLATDIAKKLMGKHKVNYAPHIDNGDYVVVINASLVKVTGDKENQKVYHKHSGYPGGYREIAFSKWKKESPEKIIRHAVLGMLPENKLKKKRIARLKVFANDKHKYESQFRSQGASANSI
ncbi:MAG: 50S ribosomal protein L13 [Patescibacteria group bacterium]|nr:50S ribosomal protein L13 [Patescibacteria group bacterium]